MLNSPIAIIGGSGLSSIDAIEVIHKEAIQTPYGEPSAPLITGRLYGVEVIFLARHGESHAVAPHKVNYRANIWSLKSKGVKNIISVAAVGAINSSFSSGSLVLPDQLIDYTHSRQHTFYDGLVAPVTHIDFTYPYTPALRECFIQTACDNGVQLHHSATYAVTQGPRLETAAEIVKYKRDGADIVGMTSMPEAALARELDIGYGLIALVVNAAAGMNPKPLVIEQILTILEENKHKAIDLIRHSLANINRLTD